MDYVFAPGRTSYDRLVRDLFRQRANTELIITKQVTPGSSSRVAINRIDQLLDCLATNDDITRPVPLIYIGTHGNDSGYMQIAFADIDIDGSRGYDSTTFETLVEAQNRNTGTIPSNTLTADAKLRIRGCNIGQDYALPFIQELSFTLGGQIQISAPKHYHFVKPLPNAGWYECFCYQFQVSVLSRFTGTTARADLISEFQNADHEFRRPLHNTLLNDWWEKWIPASVSLGSRSITHRVNLNPPILPRVGQPINFQRITISNAFRAERVRYTYTLTGVTANPGSSAQQVDVIKNAIRNSQYFDDDHNYPQHKRYEFDTVEDFIDGHTWVARYISDRDTLIGVGTRYLYTIIVPITDNPDPVADISDATKNKLLYNFYPNNTNTNPAVELISEDDQEIFQIL